MSGTSPVDVKADVHNGGDDGTVSKIVFHSDAL